MWLGVSASPALVALERDLDDVCASLGVAREERSFHPHVTLARIGPRVTRAELQALLRTRDALTVRAALSVHSVDLMQSVAGRYVPLHRATLAG